LQPSAAASSPSSGGTELLDVLSEVGADIDGVPLWEGFLDQHLRLPRCTACGFWIWFPRPACPRCWSHDVVWEHVSGGATLYTYVLFPQAGGVFPLAVVELDEQPGLRLSARLDLDGGDVPALGSRLLLGWTRVDGVPVPAFAPARAAGS
jgi:uncharacterized OB-fold protein